MREKIADFFRRRDFGPPVNEHIAEKLYESAGAERVVGGHGQDSVEEEDGLERGRGGLNGSGLCLDSERGDGVGGRALLVSVRGGRLRRALAEALYRSTADFISAGRRDLLKSWRLKLGQMIATVPNYTPILLMAISRRLRDFIGNVSERPARDWGFGHPRALGSPNSLTQFLDI